MNVERNRSLAFETPLGTTTEETAGLVTQLLTHGMTWTPNFLPLPQINDEARKRQKEKPEASPVASERLAKRTRHKRDRGDKTNGLREPTWHGLALHNGPYFCFFPLLMFDAHCLDLIDKLIGDAGKISRQMLNSSS